MIKPIMKDVLFLQQKSEAADIKDLPIAADLEDTLRANRDRCVGMAANMIGHKKRIIIVSTGFADIVMINPVITEQDGEQTGYEGCLSVPGMTGIVTRPEHVVCEALNEKMEPFTIDAHGLLARCICHELAHLDGHLYPEIASEMMTNEELERREAEESEEEE